MVLGPDCVGWMDAPPVDDTVNWTRDGDVAGDEMDPKGHPTDMSMPMSMPCSFSTFKSMLDADASWYLNPAPPPPPLHDLSGHLHQNPHAFKDITFCPNPNPETNNNNNNNAMFFDPSSCSSSPAAAFLNQQPFLGFDLAPEPLHYLPPFQPPQLNPNSVNTSTNNPGLSSGSFGAAGFGFHGGVESGSSNALFFNRPKVLRPLEVMPQTGSQPTLFQKRAAKLGNLEISGAKRKRAVDDGDLDDDLSGINYDSDDGIEFSGQMGGEKNDAAGGGSSSVANSGVTAGEGSDPKGKKKGMPAKNLMAERRRRKKLNDRLYMLRSVVPKISKMDRASILGDAIDYLKELLQRISDLHNELESSTPQGGGGGASATPASFHPLTPTPPTLPCRVKDELGPTNLHSPKGQAAARVEVRAREGRAVNIHMFCARRPGLLLSTMRALDTLGLDIQQAVISCFNGFALDVFRAEQCREGQDVLPEQIKAMLLDSAGITNMI